MISEPSGTDPYPCCTLLSSQAGKQKEAEDQADEDEEEEEPGEDDEQGVCHCAASGYSLF
jgi:hypothetical protein